LKKEEKGTPYDEIEERSRLYYLVPKK